MTRQTFVSEMDHQLKLVRTEYGLTQDVMAKVLGISKKRWLRLKRDVPLWGGPVPWPSVPFFPEAGFFPVCWVEKQAI